MQVLRATYLNKGLQAQFSFFLQTMTAAGCFFGYWQGQLGAAAHKSSWAATGISQGLVIVSFSFLTSSFCSMPWRTPPPLGSFGSFPYLGSHSSFYKFLRRIIQQLSNVLSWNRLSAELVQIVYRLESDPAHSSLNNPLEILFPIACVWMLHNTISDEETSRVAVKHRSLGSLNAMSYCIKCYSTFWAQFESQLYWWKSGKSPLKRS